MSGGSFNYLYLRDVHELIDQWEELTHMIALLKREGCDEAARDTQRVLDRVLQFDKCTRALAAALSDVWRSIEMRESGDGTHEAVKSAVGRYRSPHVWTGPSKAEVRTLIAQRVTVNRKVGADDIEAATEAVMQAIEASFASG